MGLVKGAAPKVVWILAAFSQYESLLDGVGSLLGERFGPPALVSPRFAFTQTDYYRATMGGPLRKQFFAGGRLVGADSLPDMKLATNDLEDAVRAGGEYDVTRPLNLDPGYLDSGKLVLASTKDHAHRVYLRDGIFAEVTLYYHDHQWRAWPWTYPDYRRDESREFFERVRRHYRSLLTGAV